MGEVLDIGIRQMRVDSEEAQIHRSLRQDLVEDPQGWTICIGHQAGHDPPTVDEGQFSSRGHGFILRGE